MGLSRGLGFITLVLVVFFTLGLVVAGIADGDAARSQHSAHRSAPAVEPAR